MTTYDDMTWEERLDADRFTRITPERRARIEAITSRGQVRLGPDPEHPSPGRTSAATDEVAPANPLGNLPWR